jgi:hypothetical protein
LLLAQGIEFLRAHIAGVDMARQLQLLQHLAVAWHALHLVDRSFVVVQSHPGHAVENDLHGFLRRTLDVGVFNAQNEGAAVVLGESPWIERGADISKMDEARWTRGEAGANGVACCAHAQGFEAANSCLGRPTLTALAGATWCDQSECSPRARSV